MSIHDIDVDPIDTGLFTEVNLFFERPKSAMWMEAEIISS